MSIYHFARILARIAAAPFCPNTYLGVTERAVRAAMQTSAQPQLFIAGPPRSGTTLISQYIVHRLRVAYFTNGVGRFPVSPCLATWAQRFLHGEYVSDFLSQYGKVKGPLAPREAGGFWNLYFDPDTYQDHNPLSVEMTERLQRTVACVQRAFGDTPFVNKNVKHLLRLKALEEIFPQSVFLIVDRDLSDAAISMLRARHRLFGDSNRWFSIRPPDYDALSTMAPVDQIVGQYHSLVRKMETDIQKIPQERICRIYYDDFCRNPEGLIDRLIEFLGPLEYRNPAISSFPVRRNSAETDEEMDLVRRI